MALVLVVILVYLVLIVILIRRIAPLVLQSSVLVMVGVIIVVILGIISSHSAFRRLSGRGRRHVVGSWRVHLGGCYGCCCGLGCSRSLRA